MLPFGYCLRKIFNTIAYHIAVHIRKYIVYQLLVELCMNAILQMHAIGSPALPSILRLLLKYD